MNLPGDQSLGDLRKEVEEAKYENMEKEKVQDICKKAHLPKH